MSVQSGRATVAVVVVSEVLRAVGVPHGFSTRLGGVSSGAYGSLNFGSPGNLDAHDRDPAPNIAANWAALVAQIDGASGREIIEVHQVHGAAACVVRRGEPSARERTGHDQQADAIVTDDPARLAAIRVADCAPVLIASGDGAIVAAVHAGWRGALGGVIGAAVAEMVRLGARAGQMAAAVGPCIGAEAFEVGEDVAARFQAEFGAQTAHVRRTARGIRVDLKGSIRERLLRAGLEPGRVDVLGHCTVSDSELFFSHRRDKGVTGRMVGVIGPRGG